MAIRLTKKSTQLSVLEEDGTGSARLVTTGSLLREQFWTA